MTKIYSVIKIKLNLLVQYCPYDDWLANKAYFSDSDKHFSDFYLQDGGKNQLA